MDAPFLGWIAFACTPVEVMIFATGTSLSFSSSTSSS
jgi:hypothetical protein